MKKIGLFLEAEPWFGGTFQYNQTMLAAVAALPRDRYAVVVGYTAEVWRDYLAPYEVDAVQIPRGFWGRAIGLAWMLLRLPMGLWRRICPPIFPIARALQREKCDLWIFPAQDMRSFQCPVPALVTILDMVHLYGRRFPEAVSAWEALNRTAIYPNLCRWAKGILVVSELDRRQVMEACRVPGEKVHPLPMVAPNYLADEAVPEDFDARLQLPPKYLFYPAQFWTHKNHRNLILALASLKGELPDLKLVLVGSKKNAWDAVVGLIHEQGLTDDVILPGYVPDAYMPELYRRARALIMPTYYGPTNLPPLEALAVGCPMALSEITAMPERVGDAALRFDPDDVGAIAACIRRLWCDDALCAELSARGRARAGQWGQPQFNEQLREIIDTVLAQNAG